MGCLDCLMGKGCHTSLNIGDFFLGAVAADVVGGRYREDLIAGVIALFAWPALAGQHGIPVSFLTGDNWVIIGVTYFILRYAYVQYPLMLALAVGYVYYTSMRKAHRQAQEDGQLPPKGAGDRMFTFAGMNKAIHKGSWWSVDERL